METLLEAGEFAAWDLAGFWRFLGLVNVSIISSSLELSTSIWLSSGCELHEDK